MKILVVDPIVKTQFTKHIDNIYSSLNIGGLALDFESLKEGPLSVETEEDEKSAVPDLLRVIKEGERGGYDAIIINCFGNPGLEEGRKLVKVLVIGAGEASFLKSKEWNEDFLS